MMSNIEIKYLDVASYSLVTFICQCLTNKCGWAELENSGVVDRRGQNTLCTACKLCYAIRSEYKQFFCRFRWFGCVTTYSNVKMSRSGSFSADDRWTIPITLPLVHALG